MKSGFITVIGRPNVGKSTLINQFLDYELAIVSKTPQTTRNQIRGIYNDDECQIVFIDTPGIHKPKSKLGESLNKASYRSLKNVDLILFVTPINEEIGPGDKLILSKIDNFKNKIAIISKVDLAKNDNVLEVRQKLLKEKYDFPMVLGVSALNSYGPRSIIAHIKELLNEGPKYYDNEYLVTDQPSIFFVKEIIRGEVLKVVYDEVAHSIGVIVDEYKEHHDSLTINATIFVERESQKPILIGKKGSMIKKIGTKSRQKIANVLGKTTHLNLRVKVEKKWTKNSEKVKKFGY